MAFFGEDDERLRPLLPFDRHEAIGHLSTTDEKLSSLIEQVGPFDLELHPMHSTFGALARVIVYQQLSGRAASTIFKRVAELFGGEAKLSARRLPDFTDDDLRAAGLSRAKTAALRDLGRHVNEGHLPDHDTLRNLDLESLYPLLTQVRGVGRWSVDMIAIFWLGHPDVLPSTDLGIRKGFQLVYGLEELPPPQQIVDHAERWRPFRSVASWYLWRAVDTATV